MKRQRNQSSTGKVLLFGILLLTISLVWFAVSVYRNMQSEKVICQSVVPLGDFTYDDTFLKQAENLPGIRSLTPVYELPARLKVDGLTMEATFTGVDLEELRMRTVQGAPTPLGRTLVLLLGEKSLSGMTDVNGQPVSEKRQKELLEKCMELEWQYQMVNDSQNAQARPEETGWKVCLIAGVLSEPSEGIYLPSYQAVSFLNESGAGAKNGITGFLLTVQGEENYRKALEAMENR